MNQARGRDVSAATPAVRLDSLDPGRGARSFRFSRLVEVLRADRVEEVVPVIAAAERAAGAGLHATGFVAYEAAPAFDPALVARPPRPGLPLAWFAVWRHREDVAPLAGLPELGVGRGSGGAAGDRARSGGGDGGAGEVAALGPWEPALSEAGHREAVVAVREHIAAGDTYQVNLTFPLRAAFRGDPATLYGRLCRAQRSAHCALFELDERFTLVSASPELFFRWRGDGLTLRPMKGTRPRGRWSEEDEGLAAELLASAKERAENLMIVDLLRNDAGRVAVPGSVRVERLFEVERYETVHQLTSTVEARTRPGTTLVDLFRALFPCGSVTGAPKIRTMELIAGLEPAARGVYCGALGHVSPDGATFNVPIRTLLLDRQAGSVELGVGSGVTWDSEPAAEYAECLAKARFVRRDPQAFRLLETLLWEPAGGFFLREGHLARLAASARRFGFAFDLDAARSCLDRAVASGATAGGAAVRHGAAGSQAAAKQAGGCPDGAPVSVAELASALSPATPATGNRAAGGPLRVRLTLGRGGDLEAESRPLAPLPEPVRVSFATAAVDAADPLLFHKTTRREGYERRAAARPDRHDVLLVNGRGEVTESTVANLVVRLDGELVTPPLASGLLPGVFRAELLRRGEVRERVLRRADVEHADEVWLVSSVRRWRRAELLP
ncbi:MAG TPA: aminodeoxychorismate synthase component I [Thermoanaerobaculia bacterium]|nr:aminodeoxychorismate synthase component I [Thermoanaerobaculia bacterium]